MAIQTYMYSLLQSLRLITPHCTLSASFLVPFGELAPTQLVSLPANLCFDSLAKFGLDLLKTPSLLVYLYVYLRPVLELRIYRLIRRRLPKPSLADELSIRVAFENDLIDWMVPTLGRRSEEENRRGHLTFYEDIKYELSILRNWAFSWLGFKRKQPSSRGANSSAREQRIESLRQCIEVLQSELGATQPRTDQAQLQSSERQQPPVEQASAEQASGVRHNSNNPNVSLQTSAPETIFDGDRILQNEENRVAQSPDAMSTDFSEMPPLGRTTNVASNDRQSHQQTAPEAPRNQGSPEQRRNSRSNTLFSRPSSPETSPPTSPRVRASLIHQNSDIITMQLELLSNRNSQGQGQTNRRPRTANERVNLAGLSADRESIAEILESLLSDQDPDLATIVNSDAMDSDGLSNLTAEASPAVVDGPSAAEPQSQQDGTPAQRPAVESLVDVSVPGVANILPDSIEEPRHEDTQDGPLDGDLDHENMNPELRPPSLDTQEQPQPVDNSRTPAHRVTILSSHPVDSLASHLASMITTVLFLPLESLYLRSLASSYLSSRNYSPALSDVRPLGAWGGGGSGTDTLAYIGKMTLMMGIQVGVNASVWGVISGSAIRIGKRFCGWGSL